MQVENDFESFEEYFASLSKSTRQNYRTAKNRLSKDKRAYKIECHCQRCFSKQLMKDFRKAHKKNLKGKYKNIKRGFLKTAILDFLKVFVYGKYDRDTPACYSMLWGNSHILAILKIDGKNAVYYYGLLSNEGGKSCVHFFRVTMENTKEFARYSPGVILGIEFIKENFNKFRVFDWTIGGEKYKYDLGCKEVQNKDAIFVLEKSKKGVV